MSQGLLGLVEREAQLTLEEENLSGEGRREAGGQGKEAGGQLGGLQDVSLLESSQSQIVEQDCVDSLTLLASRQGDAQSHGD